MAHVRTILGLAFGLGLLAALPVRAQEGQPPAPPAPAPAPTPSPEEAAAAKLETARGIAKRIQGQLQTLTPRTFVKDVGVAYQSDADFRAYMRRTMAEETPPEKLEGMTDAWVVFGFVPEGTDLVKLLEDAMASQALAYYDPKVDTFFIVKDLAPAALGEVMLHELEHAIQAQRFGLVALQAALMGKDQSDRLEALRFLWEGEATFVMLRPQLGRVKEPHLSKLLRLQADAVVQTPFAQLLKLQEMQLRMSGAKDIAAQMEATRKIPPFLLRGLQLAYVGGAAAIQAVHSAQGWAGVDALWTRPPTSTEQTLHPEKLMAEPREEPVEVPMPALDPVLGEGWTLRLSDTMGESSVWLLLADQLPPEARGGSGRAAAGWGGDRYAVWKRAGGRPLLAWLTVWDRDDDATEFADAYAAAAGARNVARNWPAAGLRHVGRAVAIVEGTDDAALVARILDALVAGTPPLPPPAADPPPPVERPATPPADAPR